MSAAVISHKLDLLVRLIDTTTGREVEERAVTFTRNGDAVHPIPRGNGNHVFINCGRENGQLAVKVSGYEPCVAQIDYETLDSIMPIKEVYLIPSENTKKGEPVITLSGCLPGLSKIEAVNMAPTNCFINKFEERKCIMHLFKTHKSALDDIHYGLINVQDSRFEPFIVEKELSEMSVKIKHPLKEPFSVNSPISRIVFGYVSPEGDYCLRVRDDSTRLSYLVRYIVGGEEKFTLIDFHNSDEVCLK